MLKILKGIVVSVFLIASAFGQAQEIPNLKEVAVKAVVGLSAGIYTYTYTVTNGPQSTGHIWRWTVDIEQPQGGVELGAEGLVNDPSYHQETSRLNQNNPAVPKMVPVGHFSPPNWGGD